MLQETISIQQLKLNRLAQMQMMLGFQILCEIVGFVDDGNRPEHIA